VLYQNDDFGKDYFIGLRDGLGDKADKMIVATQTYETTDPTVDSQVVSLQGSGADVLLTAAIPKFAAQAIRKVYDIGWKPTQFLTSVSNSVGAVMRPAGPEKGSRVPRCRISSEPSAPGLAARRCNQTVIHPGPVQTYAGSAERNLHLLVKGD
jgi:branched-chain amino acid transport system substrate-binding protein